jgi:hypothetical protein
VVLPDTLPSTRDPLHTTVYGDGAVTSSRYEALDDTTSRHGNQDGAPNGCDATIAPSESSSHPRSPHSAVATGTGVPAYRTSTVNAPRTAARMRRTPAVCV